MAPSVSRNFKANINHNDGVLDSMIDFCFPRRVQVDLALCLCRNEDVVNVIACHSNHAELSNDVNKLSISTLTTKLLGT